MRDECNLVWLYDSRAAGHAGTGRSSPLAVISAAPAESSLRAKKHALATSVDAMAVVEGRFLPAPIRGRLQSDLSGVAPAQETAGAPHGPAGGPCAVNWFRVRSASLEFSLARRPPGACQGQRSRRPSPHVLPGLLSGCLNHVLWNSKVPRTELYEAPTDRL